MEGSHIKQRGPRSAMSRLNKNITDGTAYHQGTEKEWKCNRDHHVTARMYETIAGSRTTSGMRTASEKAVT